MKSIRTFALLGLLVGPAGFMRSEPIWLPKDLPPLPAHGEVLCPRDYLTPGQGAALLDAARSYYKDQPSWQSYADLVRKKIQEGAGLLPWPKRTPLHAVVRDRRVHDGYSVENVALETVPGVFACGNLYRPLQTSGPVPAVLTTHGHTAGVKTPQDWARHGRFNPSVQLRAATLARMGAIVLTIDMFGYGDSLTQFGSAAHQQGTSMTFQLWNGIRALDFLSSLEGVDSKRLAVTGESGGGTQTILLTAMDSRVAVSVPVVMVSSYFFGGCPCESGRPIHRSAEHFASNAIIAAIAAPRPMLLVSDGGDWTKFTPEAEFPFAQSVYRLYGAEGAVANVHLPEERHDYGPSKRAAMYRFLHDRFGLATMAVTSEETVTIESPDAMRVFGETHPLPENACRNVEDAVRALRELQGPPPAS